MAPKSKPAPAEAEPRTRTPNPLRAAAIDFASATSALADLSVREKRLRDQLDDVETAKKQALKDAEAARKTLDSAVVAAAKAAGAKPARRARKEQPDAAPAPARRTPKPGSDEEE